MSDWWSRVEISTRMLTLQMSWRGERLWSISRLPDALGRTPLRDMPMMLRLEVAEHEAVPLLMALNKADARAAASNQGTPL